jgi:hypothetical protein
MNMVHGNILVRRFVLVSVFVLLVSCAWCSVGASAVPSAAVSSSVSGAPSVLAPVAVSRTFISTSGALTPLKPHDFTNFTVLGGGALQVRLLGVLFNRSLVQLLILHVAVPVFNLSFSVNYSRVAAFPLLRHRYSPVTFVVNRSGVSFLRNKAHTVVVQGFTGMFQFDRAKVLKGGLARFSFIGIAQDVSVQRW